MSREKQTQKLRVRGCGCRLALVPPLAASEAAKPPLPVAGDPRSQVSSPPEPTPKQGVLAVLGWLGAETPTE